MELIRLKGIDNHRCGEWCRRVFEFGSPLFGHRFGFLADHNPRMYRDIGSMAPGKSPTPPHASPQALSISRLNNSIAACEAQYMVCPDTGTQPPMRDTLSIWASGRAIRWGKNSLAYALCQKNRHRIRGECRRTTHFVP